MQAFKCSTDRRSVASMSDALGCLLPWALQTKGILSGSVLGNIKKGGCVIKLARGGHLVAGELIAALDSGHLAHAYLDVFEPEPLPADNALWRHPKVTLTPHAAALTDARTAVPRIVDNIERLRSGRPLLNVVDLELGY